MKVLNDINAFRETEYEFMTVSNVYSSALYDVFLSKLHRFIMYDGENQRLRRYLGPTVMDVDLPPLLNGKKILLWIKSAGHASYTAVSVYARYLEEQQQIQLTLGMWLDALCPVDFSKLVALVESFKKSWELGSRTEFLMMMEGVGTENSTHVTRYLFNEFVSMDICSYNGFGPSSLEETL